MLSPGALVVENGHGQPGHALEKAPAQATGKGLGEADVDDELAHAKQPAAGAVAGADLVFRLRGGVLAVEQAQVGAAGATAEQEQHGDVGGRDGEHDAEGIPVVHQLHERRHERRKRHLRRAEGLAQDGVVHHDLRQPRQRQRRENQA